MLKNLLKYELPKFLRFLGIFYGLSIVFSILARVFLEIDNSLVALIIGEIFRGAAISMMFSSVINCLMRSWVLFRQNMYGDESYLTHTLPVPRKTLYASKMITAWITMFISMIVVVLSLLIMFYSDSFVDMFKQLLSSSIAVEGLSVWTVIVALLLLLFFQFMSILQSGFTGMIIGHKMPNKKIGLSVLFGFVSYMAGQIVNLIVMAMVAVFDEDFAGLLLHNVMPPYRTFMLVVCVCTVVYAVLMAAFWLINTRLLQKGVDIE